MTNLVDLLTRANPDLIGQDAETVIYEDKDVRAKATHAIRIAGPCGGGLLAVLEDPDGTHVSFVALEWASGDDPILWAPVFSGCGPSSVLRELRHTNWGENGYVHSPHGGLIADAFANLERWFDVGMPPITEGST